MLVRQGQELCTICSSRCAVCCLLPLVLWSVGWRRTRASCYCYIACVERLEARARLELEAHRE
eukprot:scaffold31936_cov27-Tisochrysis_lutea.AAC.1